MDQRGDRKMNPDGRLKAVRHTGPSSPFLLRAQRVWRRNASPKRLLKETLPSCSFMNEQRLISFAVAAVSIRPKPPQQYRL
jgi:hypothetical protein